MTAPRPSKTHIGNHALKPETLMLSYGYPLLDSDARPQTMESSAMETAP